MLFKFKHFNCRITRVDTQSEIEVVIHSAKTSDSGWYFCDSDIKTLNVIDTCKYYLAKYQIDKFNLNTYLEV